jgi:hypothetical protein
VSSRQAVIVASRVLCVYFLYNAMANLTYFPSRFLSVHHHGSAILGYDKFLFRYYLLETEGATLRLVVELLLAVVFYRCGPRICRFLSGEAAASDSPEVIPTV